MITLYCKRCKKNQEVVGLEIITTKNGKKAGKGKCPICSSKLWGFLPKETIPSATEPISPFVNPISNFSRERSTTTPSNTEEEIKEWDNAQL